MTEEQKDVKQEGANPTPVQEEKKPESEASEGVKTPESENVPKDVYEKVREAMKKEREEKRAEKKRADELEQKIADLDKGKDPEKIKDNTISLIKSDPFAMENLDLIEAKVEEGVSPSEAIAQVKAEFFDRMRSEGQPAETNQFKQQKPTAANEPAPTPKEVSFKDALAGKVDVDPQQLAAIRRLMPTRR